MNYISQGDAYSICKVLNESGNIYGFDTTTSDTHLIKDSEWGMIAYISQSRYGLDGNNIAINNVNINSGNTSVTKNNGNSLASVYAVTGVTASNNLGNGATKITTVQDINLSANGVYNWKQANGQKASCNGNIYGIYDLSGGLHEKTAGFMESNNITMLNRTKSINKF